eukprot:scaffold7534_cov69-Cylindrotheca_fusiformis.AAC.1
MQGFPPTPFATYLESSTNFAYAQAGQLYHCFQSRASVDSIIVNNEKDKDGCYKELYFVSPASLPSCDGFVPNKLQAPQIVSSPAGGVTSIQFSSSSSNSKSIFQAAITTIKAAADVMPSSSLS